VAAAWLRAWAGEGSFDACCLPDVQYEDPLAVEPLTGLAALDEHRARVRTALPDLKLERSGAVLTSGAYACIPWRAAGTHKNGTATLPATNRFLTLHGLHYVELRDGRITRARGFYDLYDAATQLGILPKRGGISETILLLVRGFGLRTGG
jgi:steroid delta-isomerase-like uncharacterized protein